MLYVLKSTRKFSKKPNKSLVDTGYTFQPIIISNKPITSLYARKDIIGFDEYAHLNSNKNYTTFLVIILLSFFTILFLNFSFYDPTTELPNIINKLNYDMLTNKHYIEDNKDFSIQEFTNDLIFN